MMFFFSSRRRHTRSLRDWSSDVCSSDLWRSARELLTFDPAKCAADAGLSLSGLAEGDVARATESVRVALAERRAKLDEEIGRASCRERGERWVGVGGRQDWDESWA